MTNVQRKDPARHSACWKTPHETKAGRPRSAWSIPMDDPRHIGLRPSVIPRGQD